MLVFPILLKVISRQLLHKHFNLGLSCNLLHVCTCNGIYLICKFWNAFQA